MTDIQKFNHEYKNATSDNDKILVCENYYDDDNEKVQAYAYNYRGSIHNKKKEYDDAVEAFTNAEACLPHEPNYYSPVGRGVAYSNLPNKHNETIKDLEPVYYADKKRTYMKPFALNAYGIALVRKTKYKEAIEVLTEAIEVLTEDIEKRDDLQEDILRFPLNERAKALYHLNRINEAYLDFNRVLAEDESNINAKMGLGLLFNKIKAYEKAISNFDQILDIDDIDDGRKAYAHNARGTTYKDMGDIVDAEKDFKAAIELGISDYLTAYARTELAQIYYEDFHDYKAAKEQCEGIKKLSAIGLHKTKKDADTILKKIKENESAKKTFEKKEKYLVNLMDKICEHKIKLKIRENEKKLKYFLDANKFNIGKTEGKSETGLTTLHVLQRWNSYTPIISENSKGGGYYLTINNQGIVIDPGFNFIENFIQANYRFNDIDCIFISHAHNDHTADLESILTLLYKYNNYIEKENIKIENDNEAIKKIKESQSNNEEEILEGDPFRQELMGEIEKPLFEKKYIKLYLTASTYAKYAPILDLKNKYYTIIIIKAGDKINLELPYLEAEIIKAKHDDLISDRDSIGMVFKDKTTAFIYTGDTGYSAEIAEVYNGVKEDCKNNNLKTVLLAHLGGFKDSEESYYQKNKLKTSPKNKLKFRPKNKLKFSPKNKLKFSPKNKLKDSFYPNHLGRIGLGKLIEALEPKICIISEFGEEFNNCRDSLANIYSETYNKPIGTFFFPADIDFMINSELKIKSTEPSTECNYLSYEDLDFKETDGIIKYFEKEKN